MWKLVVVTLSFLTVVHSAPTIRIGETTLTGKNIGASGNVEFFGAIPFAQPPVGNLRLDFPVLLTKIKEKTLDARNFGPGCLQIPSPPGPGVSEDCLTLNVVRPAGISSKSRLPVLVWIYGGGFVVGSTSFYDASVLVEKSVSRGTPIMVVTINYRVGPLGFPQGAEAGQRKILNLGLHDQLVALQWIQQNIASFGGDRSKVTVSGESAGAGSITNHLLEPTIKGLARGVILESTGSNQAFLPDRNEANWQQYVAAIPSCASFVGTNNTFDCIRNADSASLQQALITSNLVFGNSTFREVIDGPGGLIVDRPSKIIAKGNLPILLGSNKDEGALFTPQSIASADAIEQALTATFSPPIVSPEKLAATIATALELYPDNPALGSPFGTGNDTFGLSSQYKRYAAILGDLMFHSSRRTLSEQISNEGLPVFVYHFTDPDAVGVAEFTPASAAPGSLGIPHTSEIPYVFGQLLHETASARALSGVMQDYWISFVNGLDPNDSHGGKRPHWQKYTPNNKVLLQLNGKHTAVVKDTFRETQIAFWQNNPDVIHR